VKGTCQECATSDKPATTPFRAVAMTTQTPRILEGPSPTVAMNSIEEFSIRTNGGDAEKRLEALVPHGSADLVHGSGSDMFEALKVLKAANPQQYKPAAALTIRAHRSASGCCRLRSSSRRALVLKSRSPMLAVGHARQPGRSAGSAGQPTRDFSQSISALVADLGDRMDDVVILTMSEFGRTVKQNGTVEPITVTPARCS
jgi:uncharacterized protein (DUF1501 family)